MNVAFIMDGNRRWAVSQGLSKLEGHKFGGEKLKEVIKWGKELGFNSMTFYTFSTENFNRSLIEKEAIFRLFKSFMKDFLSKERDYKIRFLGRKEMFPKDIQELMHKIEKKEEGYPLYFCMAYGGRQEIVDACKKAIKIGEVNDKTFSKLLYSEIEPDMIIRTGGVKRISNFLLWQSAYSEWFFPETFWPALTKEELIGMIEIFKTRTRNYGK